MRIIIRLLLTVSLGILLFSCAKILYIGKRIDPEIILEKEQHNIVFVNLFDYTSSINIKKNDEVSFHNGVMGLLEGLSSFSSDPTFNFVVGDTLKNDIESGFLTTLLPVDSVSAICNRNKSNILLALDSLNTYFDWETTAEDDINGFTSKTKNFYINTRFFLSLYSITGDLLNRSEVDQSTFYRSRPILSGIITIVPSLERARQDIGELAFQSGLDYVSKFYPHMTQDTQELYSGKPFRVSNRYVFSRDWKKATELLEELAKNSDHIIAEKAKHNLEVVKEAAQASER
jgi:hypothetical protein